MGASPCGVWLKADVMQQDAESHARGGFRNWPRQGTGIFRIGCGFGRRVHCLRLKDNPTDVLQWLVQHRPEKEQGPKLFPPARPGPTSWIDRLRPLTHP